MPTERKYTREFRSQYSLRFREVYRSPDFMFRRLANESEHKFPVESLKTVEPQTSSLITPCGLTALMSRRQLEEYKATDLKPRRLSESGTRNLDLQRSIGAKLSSPVDSLRTMEPQLSSIVDILKSIEPEISSPVNLQSQSSKVPQSCGLCGRSSQFTYTP